MNLELLYHMEMMRKRRIAGSGTLSWSQIASWTQANTLLSHIAIGDVVDLPAHDWFPALRYRLAHVNYNGGWGTVSEYCGQPYNSIWIPYKLPCLGSDLNAYTRPFDAPELEYAVTWDTTFLTGKIYYRLDGASYVPLTSGVDYTDGENVAAWMLINGNVYGRNHANRVTYGSSRWRDSNLRQWLNSSGSNWFQKQNEYDQLSGTWIDGYLSGLDVGISGVISAVNNRTTRNSVSVITGGAGGGVDTTVDLIWSLGRREIGNIGNDGTQLDYYKDIANTDALRILRGENNAAYIVWLRSILTPYTASSYAIYTNGSLQFEFATSSLFAFLPSFCIA